MLSSILEWFTGAPWLCNKVKVNILYAEGTCIPTAECYFEPGQWCKHYEGMLAPKVGKGQMYRGPVTLMRYQTLSAGEYTYLIPGAEPKGKKPVLVPNSALKEQANGYETLSSEMKQHVDSIITSRLREALGSSDANKQ